MGTHVRSISIVVNRQSLARLICIMLLFVYWMPFAYSSQSCLDNFNSTYPNSASGDVGCQLCHVQTTGGAPANGYGWDLSQNGGRNSRCAATLFGPALAAVEWLDSDGEGHRNIDEINASTQPGWTTMGNLGFTPFMEELFDADPFIPSVDLDPALPAPEPDEGIIIKLEEPRDDSNYSGIGNLRGFALSIDGIERVELYVDGKYKGDLPYGGSRRDVGEKNPEIPNSNDSGFSQAFNYNNLALGEHTITARAIAKNGEFNESSGAFTVQKFHKSFFSDSNAIDLSGLRGIVWVNISISG